MRFYEDQWSRRLRRLREICDDAMDEPSGRVDGTTADQPHQPLDMDSLTEENHQVLRRMVREGDQALKNAVFNIIGPLVEAMRKQMVELDDHAMELRR